MIPHRLFVGTIGEGVFRSLDHGESFRRAMDGTFVECDVRALVVDPDEPRTLYLGTELGLLRSTDGADSWERIESSINDLPVWSILARRGLLMVGTCPSRLFRSEDGRSFKETTPEIRPDCPRIMRTRVTTLAGDPTQPNDVWAGVEIDAVWRSRDGGATWKRQNNGISSADIHNIVIVPGKPRRLLAATNNDLNISEDDGESWRPLEIGKRLPRGYCRGLGQVVGRPRRILLGIGDGPPGWSGFIGISDDAGDTWRTATMPGPANSTIWNFAVHPADASMIYASSVSGQVYRSLDAGDSWSKLRNEFGEIRALAWSPEPA